MKLFLISAQALLKKGTDAEQRLLEFCFNFAEIRFGKRYIVESFRESKDKKDRMNNWECDMGITHKILSDLGEIYLAVATVRDITDIRDPATKYLQKVYNR